MRHMTREDLVKAVDTEMRLREAREAMECWADETEDMSRLFAYTLTRMAVDDADLRELRNRTIARLKVRVRELEAEFAALPPTTEIG